MKNTYVRSRRIRVVIAALAGFASVVVAAGTASAAPVATATGTTDVVTGSVINISIDGTGGFDGAAMLVVSACGNALPDGTPIAAEDQAARGADDCWGASEISHVSFIVAPVDGTTYNINYTWTNLGIGINDTTCVWPANFDCTVIVTLLDATLMPTGSPIQIAVVPPLPDVTDPLVTLATPAEAAVFVQGQNVNADYSCTDADSGVESCSGDVASGSPIDTATLGAHTFAVTGVDNVGRTTTVTHSYTVAALNVVQPGVAHVIEGGSGSFIAEVPLTLAAPSLLEVTVDWSTAGGTAVAPDDYNQASGTVTFAPGETEAMVPVTINGDERYEFDEVMAVALANPTNATLGGFGFGLVVIDDDDPRPKVTPGSVVANPEGDTGSTIWNLPVMLSAPAGVPVSVNWNTADIAANPLVAHPGSDYVEASGTLTFPPGETVKHIPIEILGDTDDEPPLLDGEWGLVQLTTPINTSVSGGLFGLGVFVIIDDDHSPISNAG